MQSQLEESIEDGRAWESLSCAVQQLAGSKPRYVDLLVRHCATKCVAWEDCPSPVQQTINASSYYTILVDLHRVQLKVYPYPFISYLASEFQLLPFDYYRNMCLDIMKAERR